MWNSQRTNQNEKNVNKSHRNTKPRDFWFDTNELIICSLKIETMNLNNIFILLIFGYKVFCLLVAYPLQIHE